MCWFLYFLVCVVRSVPLEFMLFYGSRVSSEKKMAAFFLKASVCSTFDLVWSILSHVVANVLCTFQVVNTADSKEGPAAVGA